MKTIVALVLAVLAFAIVPDAARADAVDDALAHFTLDKFPETEKGVDALTASGAPTTAAVFGALRAGRLLFDPASHALYYADEAGALHDAKTGAAAPADITAGNLKKVRLNNGVRSKLDAAGGSLGLVAADPASASPPPARCSTRITPVPCPASRPPSPRKPTRPSRRR